MLTIEILFGIQISMSASAYYREERAKYYYAQATLCTEDEARKMVTKLCETYNIPIVKFVVNARRRNWSIYRPPRIGDTPHVVNPRHHRYYREEGNTIDIAPTMMNWRVVAHELAHAVHTFDYDARFTIARDLRNETLPKERWHGPEHKKAMAKVIASMEALGVFAPKTQPMIWKVESTMPSAIIPGNIFQKAIDTIEPISYTENINAVNPKPEQNMSTETLVTMPVVSTTPVETVTPVTAETKPEAGTVPVPQKKMTKRQVVIAALYASLPKRMVCPHCKKSRIKSAFGVRVMAKDSKGVPTLVKRQSWCKPCR